MSDEGWGAWFRRIIEKYFVFIIFCIVVWFLWYTNVISAYWVVDMTEKIVDKFGFNF